MYLAGSLRSRAGDGFTDLCNKKTRCRVYMRAVFKDPFCTASQVLCYRANNINTGHIWRIQYIGSTRFICEASMVAVRNRPTQISYCRCCNRHFDSLGVPIDFGGTTNTSNTCQRDRRNGTNVDSSGGQDWTSEIRTVVKLASHVHSVTCQSCNVRNSNPLPDYK